MGSELEKLENDDFLEIVSRMGENQESRLSENEAKYILKKQQNVITNHIMVGLLTWGSL